MAIRTPQEIIRELAEARTVETIVRNTGPHERPEDLADLAQMIYVWLLELPEEKLTGLDERGQLPYWIARIAQNNVWSRSSPYRRQVTRLHRQGTTLDKAEGIPDSP